MSDQIDLFEELLVRYRVSLLGQHDEIAQALWVDDLERASGVAHVLKGTAGSFGLSSIAEQAQLCEMGYLDGIESEALRARFLELMDHLMLEVPLPSTSEDR